MDDDGVAVVVSHDSLDFEGKGGLAVRLEIHTGLRSRWTYPQNTISAVSLCAWVEEPIVPHFTPSEQPNRHRQLAESGRLKIRFGCDLVPRHGAYRAVASGPWSRGTSFSKQG